MNLTCTHLNCFVAGSLCKSPCLVYSNTTNLITLDPETSVFRSIVSGLKTAVAVEVHFRLGLVFWSTNDDTDPSDLSISRANIDGSNISTVIHLRGLCEGLSVDWMSYRLYWTDATHDKIEVANLDGTDRRELIDLGLDKPRGIAVDPHSR